MRHGLLRGIVAPDRRRSIDRKGEAMICHNASHAAVPGPKKFDLFGVQICVGLAFDFLSANKATAAQWMQRYGLEWLLHSPRGRASWDAATWSTLVCFSGSWPGAWLVAARWKNARTFANFAEHSCPENLGGLICHCYCRPVGHWRGGSVEGLSYGRGMVHE